MILMGLIGMDFSPHGVAFRPLLPEGVTALELRGLPYRGATLNIHVNGVGSKIAECSINGQISEPAFIDARAEGDQEIDIRVHS